MCVCGGELGKAGLICCHFVSLPQDQTCVLLMKNSSDIRTAPRGTEHGYETHVRPRLNTASVCVCERECESRGETAEWYLIFQDEGLSLAEFDHSALISGYSITAYPKY